MFKDSATAMKSLLWINKVTSALTKNKAEWDRWVIENEEERMWDRVGSLWGGIPCTRTWMGWRSKPWEVVVKEHPRGLLYRTIFSQLSLSYPPSNQDVPASSPHHNSTVVFKAEPRAFHTVMQLVYCTPIGGTSHMCYHCRFDYFVTVFQQMAVKFTRKGGFF